jgi:hypothetical protein
MGSVAEREMVGGGRTWFVDTRSPARRMAVTSHPELGVVVLSLWQGDSCTGTFRLPLAAAGELVAALVEGMVEETPADPPSSPSPSLLRRIK